MLSKLAKCEVLPTYDKGDFVLARAENCLPWPARINYFRGFHEEGQFGSDEELYHVNFMGNKDEEWAILENYLITRLSLPRI